MKIKVSCKSYDEVCGINIGNHEKPVRQSAFFRHLIRFLSRGEMKAVNFEYTASGMEKLGKDEPCLILMNHSSFTDLQIIGTLFYRRQYHIVCTNDGLIGKSGLMRRIGCIPTKKFISDPTLVRDMKYTFDTLKSSIVMYPEASYSFDGAETPLPGSLAKCLKLMKVPVIMVKTTGAFLRDPLYNCLQKRKTDVKAEVKYLLSPEDIADKSVDELQKILKDEFRYDHFKDQYQRDIRINEPFRADGLHRVLYKCPACGCEGRMEGKGIDIVCKGCNKAYTLLENGKLKAADNRTEFEFVTDWYAWERQKVRDELEAGDYLLDTDVDIKILADMKSMYSVGEGRLRHTKDGFELTGCEGKLNYHQSGKASYSLYADYFWYEIGDMICIGDNTRQYYCFPKDQKHAIVAKARLAAEEIYKMNTNKNATH